jgi:PAS domain S-box-containing protein
MIVIELIFNLALLISVSVLSGFIDIRWKRTTHLGVVLQGLLFGMVALLGMVNPFVLAPGIIFDGRSVVLSLCALFFGPVAGMIAAVIALLYRIGLGGSGLMMGVSVIISSALIGSICHKPLIKGTFKANTLNFYLIGFFVHLVMVALISVIPSSMRWVTFKTLTLTILGIYPIATALIGKILQDQTDSNDHRRAEQALLESEARFRSLFENSLMGISETEPDGRLIHANLQFARMYGYDNPQEMIAEVTSVEQFYANPLDRVEIVQILREKGVAEPREVEIKQRNGVRMLFLMSVREVRDADGRLLRYQATHVDITERKKAEQEAFKAKEKAEAGDRLKTAFLNNISHEIRTPLNGILGFGELMIDPDLTQTEREDYFSVVKSSSARLMNTVTDYMDISLIVTGNQEVKKTRFVLRDLLEEIYSAYIQSCQNKNLTLTIYTPQLARSLEITSDYGMLRNVLNHLVDNAIKFTHNGAISFGVEVKEHELEFFVTDTGIGINHEVQSIIFDKFMQENVSNTRGHEGSGLGLSIAAGLVELLGGRIRIESRIGEGSTFTFVLPMHGDTPAMHHDRNVRMTEVKKTRQMLVLIADDDESSRALLERILRKEGVDTLLVSDGMQAVAACQQNILISLVLMDLKMPVLDGYEATQQIKSFRPDLPVIAVTAYAMGDDANRALETGCNDFISKPFERRVLINKLKKFGVID